MEKMHPPPYSTEDYPNQFSNNQFVPPATAPPPGPVYHPVPSSPPPVSNINHFHMPTPPAQTVTTTNVSVVAGSSVGCPVCHNNQWTGTYSLCAWCLAICCFPVGILCCLCMRHKKCTKCGFTVS